MKSLQEEDYKRPHNKKEVFALWLEYLMKHHIDDYGTYESHLENYNESLV